MPVVTPPAITALPTPPDPNTRSTFVALAYPWTVAQGVFATQISALATNVAANATDAATSATTAATQAASATASATTALGAVTTSGAVLWVSGSTYAIGNVVYSPITLTNYRRRTAGAGIVDPSLDTTNWASTVPSSTGSDLYLFQLYGAF